MDLNLDRLLRLWLEPIGDSAAAEDAFRAVYADPVMVNGTALTVADLVERAHALQVAYEDLHIELIDRIDAADRVVIGFRMHGRQVGPLPTPLGTVAPTGRVAVTRVTDILTVAGGLVTDIWVVSDDLGTLMQLDAIALT